MGRREKNAAYAFVTTLLRHLTSWFFSLLPIIKMPSVVTSTWILAPVTLISSLFLLLRLALLIRLTLNMVRVVRIQLQIFNFLLQALQLLLELSISVLKLAILVLQLAEYVFHLVPLLSVELQMLFWVLFFAFEYIFLLKFEQYFLLESDDGLAWSFKILVEHFFYFSLLLVNKLHGLDILRLHVVHLLLSRRRLWLGFQSSAAR